jgi:hypothetical protein
MSAKSKPTSTRKNLGRDLASHERLPEKTKELLDLAEQAEKTPGPEQVVITDQINEKSRKARP